MIDYAADNYLVAVLADTPSAFWRLDEAVAAGTLNDSSGNGNSFAKPVGWTLGQSGPVPDGHTAAAIVNAWQTNVLSQNISGACAVELWMLATGTGAACGARTGGDFSFDIQFGAGVAHADIGNGAAWLSTTANMNIPNTKWIHIVYNFFTTGWVGYINAQQLGSGVYAGTPLLKDATRTMTIGWDSRNGDASFTGTLANVAVYAHTLSQSRIGVHYSGGLQLNRFKMDSGSLHSIRSY